MDLTVINLITNDNQTYAPQQKKTKIQIWIWVKVFYFFGYLGLSLSISQISSKWFE